MQARARARTALYYPLFVDYPGLGGWGGFDRCAHVSLPSLLPSLYCACAGWCAGRTPFQVAYGSRSLLERICGHAHKVAPSRGCGVTLTGLRPRGVGFAFTLIGLGPRGFWWG